MPNKPQNKGKQTVVQVTVDNIEKQNAQFVKYYQGINLVPEAEWKHLLESLLTDLPVTYRIAARSRRANNPYEGKPGTLSDAEVLREFMKTVILPKVSDVSIEEKQFQITPLPWYPKQMAWKTNIDLQTLLNTSDLQPLKSFAFEEEKMCNVFRQEITHMIPPLLVDILPDHKVLELCAGNGLNTVQIVEHMMVNPKKLPDGVLVSNEKEHGKLQYRWSQSTNVMFTHHDPSTFPDIYLSDEHSPDNKLSYDRIFIAAPTSDDGLMRSKHRFRSTWNVTLAQKNHSYLKKTLKRGLELLEMNGQLVYSTNSMNPIENEAVVAAVLEEASDRAELLDVRKRLPDFHVREPMVTWKVMSQGQVFYENFEASPGWFQKENDKSMFPPENPGTFNMERCMRIMPHDNDTGAMFIAVFTKLGEMPWLEEVKEEEPEQEMETEEKAEEKTEEVEEEEKKEEKEEEKPEPVQVSEENSAEAKESESDAARCPYTLPLRCDINVCVTEIDWETEVTDDNLHTEIDAQSETFELAPLQISRMCIPQSLQKKLRVSASQYTEVPETNEDWKAIKLMLDLKKLDATRNLLQLQTDGQQITYYFCSPLLKHLIKCNPEVVKRSRHFAGGLPVYRSSSLGLPEVMLNGILPLLPYMNKQLINVTKQELLLVLQNRDVILNKFSERTKAALKLADQGMVFFFYEPKGKNADPKCPLCVRREKYKLFVRNMFSSELENHHFLRLCGINPVGEAGDTEMETE